MMGEEKAMQDRFVRGPLSFTRCHRSYFVRYRGANVGSVDPTWFVGQSGTQYAFRAIPPEALRRLADECDRLQREHGEEEG